MTDEHNDQRPPLTAAEVVDKLVEMGLDRDQAEANVADPRFRGVTQGREFYPSPNYVPRDPRVILVTDEPVEDYDVTDHVAEQQDFLDQVESRAKILPRQQVLESLRERLDAAEDNMFDMSVESLAFVQAEMNLVESGSKALTLVERLVDLLISQDADFDEMDPEQLILSEMGALVRPDHFTYPVKEGDPS